MAAKNTNKKPAAKKAAKKSPAKAAKKVPAKKAAAKKAPAKKAVVKKAAVKKAVVKKTAAKKAGVKKGTPKAKAPEKAAKKVTPKAKANETRKVEKAAKPAKKAIKKSESKATRKPSLVSTPPPAPNKPKFVPPPTEPVAKLGAIGGSHTQAFIEKQRQRLLDLRDTLVDAMTGMTRDTIRNAPEGSEASGSGQHQGDAGSDAYDRDFALSVLAKEQDALYEIDQALIRIRNGAYGICEISDRKIPTARLEAIPFARLTVENQAQWEKEYGSRRFKPSAEVGFSGGKPQEDEDSVTVSLDGDDD